MCVCVFCAMATPATSGFQYPYSPAFCARMLAEAGIAATPGVDFDPERGHRFIRFSYCGPEPDMAEAPARLRRWLRA